MKSGEAQAKHDWNERHPAWNDASWARAAQLRRPVNRGERKTLHSAQSVKEEYVTKLTLMGIFLSIFTAFVSHFTNRRWGREDAKVSPLEMVLLGLTTMRLGRLFAYDLVAEPLRKPFAKTVPDETGAGETVAPRGAGVRRSLGQLISCPICIGTWIAAGLVYGIHALPNPTRIFLQMMGAIGAAEILNSLTEALTWVGQAARTIAGNGDENHD